VREALDALGVPRAHLVGHSFAGDEITAFAARHRERTLRVVYLDAAYDRAEVRRMLAFSLFTQPKPPSPPKAGKKDKGSVAAYEAYVERVHGVHWPEAEVEAALRYKGGPTLKLMMAAKSPDYRAVRAPALAIFAKQGSAKEAYAWLRGTGVTGTDVAFAALSVSGVARIAPPSLNAWNWWTGRWKPFVEDQHEKFAREIPDGEVVDMDGPHYLFLARPDDVAQQIREFLGR
jgi:pimeloyl-ACP methyl ester carboxylesterase